MLQILIEVRQQNKEILQLLQQQQQQELQEQATRYDNLDCLEGLPPLPLKTKADIYQFQIYVKNNEDKSQRLVCNTLPHPINFLIQLPL